MFDAVLGESILKRAKEKGAVDIIVHDLRNFTSDKHRKVDDRPFGGGPGMVLKPEPIFEAVASIKENMRDKSIKTRIILLTPQGNKYNQNTAKRLAKFKHLILICGHYEGIDERVREDLVSDEISIGDYVLTCGELPAMVLIDSIVRLLPGVLGNEESMNDESFARGLLEYPQYTRPAEYRGMRVPEVLLSGDHEDINKWRRKQAAKRTAKRRPDLLTKTN